nr:uncharacterized protein LOC109154451 [Ipomoea batatas]
MYQGNNQQREEAPKESMEDKMVRMFGELRQDVTNMRQEWKQDLRQEISTIRQEVSNLIQENNASLRHLETQVAQNSKALAERPQGTLPSTTVNNPRERVQAVTLRSGKELPEPTLKKNTIPKSPIEEEKIEEILEEDKEQEKVLDSNDDLESFTFDDNALINGNDAALHEIVCSDDNMHVDDNVCDMNDIEFVNFFDDCIDDAISPLSPWLVAAAIASCRRETRHRFCLTEGRASANAHCELLLHDDLLYSHETEKAEGKERGKLAATRASSPMLSETGEEATGLGDGAVGPVGCFREASSARLL